MASTRHRPTASVLAAAFVAILLALASGARGADDWRLPGLAGGSLDAGDVASGTTVMMVWAGWSPRCRDIVERSNALVSKFGGRARVVLVDFQEDPGEVSAFLAGKAAQAPVFLDVDGAFAKRHQVTTLPGLVVYRDGAVAYQGRLPDDPDRVIGDALP
jgi:thiol-disulfide isomerase/thioredoxin